MKKMMIMAICAMMIAAAGSAFAADTSTLTVQATVLGTCKFNTGAATLDFGNLDPSVVAPVNATPTNAQFWCTKGVAGETITPDQGLNWSGTARQMLDAVSGDLIAYSLTVTPDGSPNQGPAAPRTVTIGGSIAYADFANKSAGLYADTVILTINP